MSNLFFRPGSAPAALPFSAYDADGRLWTDLSNSPEGLVACDFRLAPERPSDTDTQTVEWSVTNEAWIMVDRPPAPPTPPAPPLTVSVGTFFERTTEDEADQIDEAMMAKSVKFRRLWQAANSFTEGTDLWTALRGVIVSLFSEARAGELLAA